MSTQPLTADQLDWLRCRFGRIEEGGDPQVGTLEGTIARLIVTLDAALAANAEREGLDVEAIFGVLVGPDHPSGPIHDYGRRAAYRRIAERIAAALASQAEPGNAK